MTQEDGGHEAERPTATSFLNKLLAPPVGAGQHASSPEPEKTESRQLRPTEPQEQKSTNSSTAYCQNLTQKARDGKLDLGHETQRVGILNRPPDNPCLIDAAGAVGKTAMAEGLGGRIARQGHPRKLQTRRSSHGPRGVVAGTQFHQGRFESRMKGLIEGTE